MNMKDDYGDSLIHCAAEGGNTEIVQFLLEKGVSLSDRGFIGRLPLQSAYAGGHAGTIQLLLNKGASADGRNKDC